MKIVIVGGGTAGWLSALYCAIYNQNKNKEQNEIIVIESSKIPIIGAGEGSTGLLADVIDNKFKKLGLNEYDFLTQTEATTKLGIRFKDWGSIGNEFLSPLDASDTRLSSTDFNLLAFLLYDKATNASESGYLMDKEYSPYLLNKRDHIGIHSYHFDAHKVGQYFKKVAMESGVKCIDTEIESINKNINGELESVNTTIGKIDADFWIDCSGFAKVLIEPMGAKWISYSEYLPTNTALPYVHQFEKNENVLAETLAWAQPNGWMWQIPNQKRYGCGYVYSDRFTNQDNALEELEKITGRKINPIRNIKFDAGRCDKFWIKNVAAIGLSASFLEPLQATSIHTTIVQLDLLLNTNLNFRSKDDIVYNSHIEIYNNAIATLSDDFRDLIQIHYVNDREDSKFWKYCKYEMPKTEKVKQILDLCKHRSPSSLDFKMYHGVANWGVWCWTLIGLGHITKNIAKKIIEASDNEELSINLIKRLNDRNKTTSYTLMKNKDFIKTLQEGKLIKPKANPKYYIR